MKTSKYILHLFVFGAIFGCAHNAPIEGTVTDYRVESGHYKSLSLDDWNYADPTCMHIYPIKGNLGKKWAPKVGITLQSDDVKNVFHLELVQKDKDVEILSFGYRKNYHQIAHLAVKPC